MHVREDDPSGRFGRMFHWLLVLQLAFAWGAAFFPHQSSAQGVTGDVPVTYCKIQADAKQEVRFASALKSEQLRRNNRTFYAAIEIGGIDVKGELYEIHDWSPGSSDLTIPCQISTAKVKIPFRNTPDTPDDLAAQAEDVANAVSAAVEQLNRYRPRILKVMAGSSVALLSDKQGKWAQGEYWNYLVKQIEWKTGITPVRLDRQQELLYSLISDIHLPKLDACASDDIWKAGIGELKNENTWATYCTRLVCGDNQKGSALVSINTSLAKACPGNQTSVGIDGGEKNDSVKNAKQSFQEMFGALSVMERIASLNAALRVEQANYLYANIGTSGIVFGAVAENFAHVDALSFAGINTVRSRMGTNPAASINWTLLKTPSASENETLDSWFSRNQSKFADRKGVRVVGSGAWTFALLTDMEKAKRDRASLAIAPAGEVVIQRNQVSKRVSPLIKELMSPASTVIGCAQEGVCMLRLEGIGNSRGLVSSEDWLNTQLVYMKSARMFNDRERLAVSLKVTAFFLDGVNQAIGKLPASVKQRWESDGAFLYPTTADGNWVRGYVATLDPRTEPAIRR